MRLGLFFKEGRRRKLSPLWSRIVGVLVVLFAAVELYGAPFGFIDSFILRSLFVSFGITLTFICYTPIRTEPGQSENVPVPDILLACISLAAGAYMVLNGAELVTRWTGVDPLTPADWAVTATFVLLTLEVTRRTVGPVLLGIILVFIVYNFVGEYLPGYFGHRGSTMEVFLDRMVYTYDGIFGTPVGVACTYVFMFVLFGQVFNAAGGGNFFFRLAASIAGRMRGGPAKICVIASALYGTLSGSPVSDVVTTGSITIPLMKRVGYRPEFSGAVEAVASSGGLIMPPVMGSIAFVMAEYTGISYLSICKAALLPAVLYYLSLFTMIHFEALRHGLGGTPPDLIPELRSIKRKLYYLAPLALLIVLMIAGRSIIFSALLACAAVVALSFLSPETRLTPARFLAAMENAAANLLMIAACCACVGIVIGVVTMTGFGFSFVNLMGSLAQVHIGIFLLVLAGTCVIFGMGLPSLPAYILVATFGAPALVQAGVPVLAAHLFVMYFAISSGITPPVCLVAYAGAAIADAPPMKTGFTAFKLGIAAFIVPFIFIFEPALLLMGDWATILQAVFTAVLGVVCLASSMQGWLFTESSPAERVMMFVAGIVLVYPGLLTDLIGFGTASLVFFIQIARKKRLCAA